MATYEALIGTCGPCHGTGGMPGGDHGEHGDTRRCPTCEGEGFVAIACSVCGEPAVHARHDEGERCNDCAPDGCETCFVWERGACAKHRTVVRLAAMEDVGRIWEGVRDGEAEETHAGQHPCHDGAIPVENLDEADTVKLYVGVGPKAVA